MTDDEMRRKFGARQPNAKWRKRPPTDAQMKVLRRIAWERNEPVADVTRGEASDIIGRRIATFPTVRRASRRAKAARKRSQRKATEAS